MKPIKLYIYQLKDGTHKRLRSNKKRSTIPNAEVKFVIILRDKKQGNTIF